MSLVTRKFGPNAKGSKLTIKEADQNLLYLEDLIKNPTVFPSDYIDFNDVTVSPPAYSEGRIFYADGVFNAYIDESDITLQIGQEFWVRVRNSSGSDITDGQVVYISGSQGQAPTIELAQANSVNTSFTLGVATHTIENNSFGYVTIEGRVNGINTTGGAENWSDGDEVYLSATTPGALTNIKPVAPNADVTVGTVINAANNGSLLVTVTEPTAINDITEINITAPNDNDVLQYNSSTGVWENSPPQTNVLLPDGSVSNNYIGLGDDADLKIFHNGSHSIIRETGTGSLYLQSDNNVILSKDSGTELMLRGIADGGVELYYDNVKKIETISDGVDVSGDIVIGDGKFKYTTTGNGGSQLVLAKTQYSVQNNTVLSSVGSINLFLDSLTADTSGDVAFRIFNGTDPNGTVTESNNIFKIADSGDVTIKSLSLATTPTLNNSGTDILVRNGSTGEVEYRDVTSILPSCRIVISGASGIVNTNNATDFLVPYNTVDVNTDPTIFNPVVTGGTGNQGKIQVLQAGRYYFTVRYSSFDLAQTGLPTVDGTVFLRITASKDTSSSGTAGGICVLDQSIVGTSVNGEATVVGGGIIELAANDYLGVVGFHTGATGGTGTQGFPVTNNTFLNEPSFWMVKIG